MVDITGKIDRGIPAGTETDETFVVCARNNGLSMMLIDAQQSYLPYACNPNAFGELGQCPHQKACLASHIEHLYGSPADNPPALGEELHKPTQAASFVDQAFHGLPRGNQTFRTNR